MNVIGDDHLRDWKKELKSRGLADSTIEVIWNHLSSIFKAAATQKRIARNPCREADDDVRPEGPGETKARAWTPEEAHGIREAMPRRYQIVPDLGMHSGQRQAEAFGFSPDDVDRDRMVIHLRRQLLWENGTKPYFKLPKGNKERTVSLSSGLLIKIDAHEAEFPAVTVTLPWKGPGNGGRKTATVRLLATTAFENRINPSSYNNHIMKPALVAVGLIAPREEGTTWGWEDSREKMHHRWRHTYASVQLAAGEDPVSLSHWMGHASPDITLKVYAHFMPDRGMRGRTAVDNWLEAATVLRPTTELAAVEPLAFEEFAPLTLPVAAQSMELLVQGACFGSTWVVCARMPPAVPLLGEIRTEPSAEPDRALAAGLAWLTHHCERLGLAVVCAENLSGQYPVSVRSYQVLGRVTVAVASGMRELPPKPPENSLAA
ncbi:putative phage integrase [Streptomyces bingchenggensis BCW-1]|uniref:Putative phage integrase n=1 Tax=Streptomyces bingchenggensis (strain BCW-1) TaxID=749414 RepID=D7BYS6_STRBB|nr:MULTISPECIES: tyrosine-type recombinase/integrase [Streptomyces]ADI05635.1 putative phage integrase [Streptomyces bingchenggensis BCW-1]